MAASRATVLLVDGDAGFFATLALTLRPNITLHAAATVAETFTMLQRCSPDLVMSYVDDADSVWLVEAIRARLPWCPLLVLTADERSPGLGAVARLRVHGVLRKPVSLGELLIQVHGLLNRRNARPRPHSRHVIRTLEYLAGNYGTRLTVGKLASVAAVSPSRLAHLFSGELGLSAMQYVTKLRVYVAKRLLETTDRKLSEIADMTGFCDAAHLSRAFHREVGVWPGAHRRRTVSG